MDQSMASRPKAPQMGNDAKLTGLLYSNGQMRDLGTLGGDRTYGSGLNNAEQVTGYSGTSGNGPDHAFLYRSGQMIDLATLGGRDSGGLSINEAGQVVGYSDTPFHVDH